MLSVSVLVAGYFGFKYKTSSPKAATTTVKTQPASFLKKAVYVGASQCRQCHKKEFDAWTASHHALAMQEADAKTVIGDFNNAVFVYNGIESTFFKRNETYFVRTDGPDGKLTDYPIKYTFGITPLQQYLIAFPGSRLQALSIAWDSRPESEGGQRWFSLYPDEKIDHNDQLHWTGRYQNWNMQCAECHSTHLKKNYDMATDTYKTSFSEINVACEACHGPASQHLDWARKERAPYSPERGEGLTVRLKSRWREAWRFPSSEARYAKRDRPAEDTLMNTCWACHARRSTLVEGVLPGLPLEESHRPALLTQPVYYADGQQRDEDYTWGSFRQSKMFQKGVTCMDCHEPHALTLRAEGNALCGRCHNAAEFDTAKHHFHQTGSKGAECVNCHAPERDYMVIDGRHDHSFRLPRPDLSDLLNTPNACTQCHRDRQAEWAASAMDKWYGKVWRERPNFGTVFQAAETKGLKVLPALLQIAQDPAVPSVVRATGAALASASMRPEYLPAARLLLKDDDPSVRIAALGLFESFPPDERLNDVTSLLFDPVFGVRIEAAKILSGIPESQFPPGKHAAYETALQDYVDTLRRNADWPAENVNLGNQAVREGRLDDALSAFKRALTLDPRFVGAYINLADLYRMMGQDGEGEKVLRKGLTILPDAADLYHSLGLLLIRKKEISAALAYLAKAAELAPANARYAYVYAVGVHSLGKTREALKLLKNGEARHPYDPDILSALIALEREAGHNKEALVYARKIAEILPGDSEIRELITELYYDSLKQKKHHQ